MYVVLVVVVEVVVEEVEGLVRVRLDRPVLDTRRSDVLSDMVAVFVPFLRRTI